MSLFSKSNAANPDDAVTGTDVLRATVKARNKSPHALSLIAHEVGNLSITTLEAFSIGKVDLPVQTLKALARELYGNCEFDETIDRLRSISKPATTMGIRPEPCKRTEPYVVPKYTVGPQPVNPEKPKVKTSRPGWLAADYEAIRRPGG